MDNAPAAGETRVAGVLAEFDTPAELMAAAEKVRDRGYKKWDCFTPFPVHGLDDAMGIRISYLPGLVLACGLTGFATAIFFQCWSNGVNYPWNISGKPLFSFPAFFPVTFEFTVLLSAFASFFGVLIFNQLPQLYHPTFRVDRFRRATDDKFFVWIESKDPQFAGAEGFLEGLAPAWVGRCEEPAQPTPYPKWFKPLLLFFGLFISIPPLYIVAVRGTTSPLPRIHIVQDMDFQPKFKPQSANPLFADGRAMRPAALGAVAVGESHTDLHRYEGKVDGQLVTRLPASLPVTAALMKQGQKAYNIHCAVCHGYTGDGNGLVNKRARDVGETSWVQPLSLHDPRVKLERDGHLFNVISHGVRSMPAYGYKIPADDRWAIVLYIRALQLSQDAPLDAAPPPEPTRTRRQAPR